MWVVITDLGGGKPRKAYENYRYVANTSKSAPKVYLNVADMVPRLVLDQKGTWVIFPAGARHISHLHSDKAGSGSHPEI